MKSNNEEEKKEKAVDVEKISKPKARSKETKKVQPKKQEIKYSCVQACNLLKIGGNTRNAVIKMHGSNIMTKSGWENTLKNQGFIQ